MLSPDPDWSRRGRFRAFAIWQAPTLLLALGTMFSLELTTASLGEAWHARLGVGMVVLVSIAALLAPWERWPFRFRAVLPILDLVAIAMVRHDLFAVFPQVGLLALIPVVWLAFDFGRLGVWAALVGASLVTFYPYLMHGHAPASGLEWLRAVGLPVESVVLGTLTYSLARELRRRRLELRSQSEQLAVALQVAEDSASLGVGIIETIGAGVRFFDETGQLTLSNQLAADMALRAGFDLGATQHGGVQVRGGDRKTLISLPEQVAPRALRGERVHDVLEWIGHPTDQRATLSRASRLRRPDGEPLGTLVATWDVTDMIEAIAVRDEFLATVSHELRTPLTSIIGYLELLDEELSGESSRQRVDDQGAPLEPPVKPLASAAGSGSLAAIRRNADLLLIRVSQLLSAAEIDTIVIDPHDIDPRRFLASALVKHHPAALAAGVALESEFPDELNLDAGLTIFIDAARAEQALDNLITNAIKYTPRGGRITVGIVSCTASQIRVVVSDTGVGMTTSEQRQAFDRFFRTDNARRSAAPGIGLGLGIVKKIVEAHDGEIRMDSFPGEGTTVEMMLKSQDTPRE